MLAAGVTALRTVMVTVGLAPFCRLRDGSCHLQRPTYQAISSSFLPLMSGSDSSPATENNLPRKSDGQTVLQVVRAPRMRSICDENVLDFDRVMMATLHHQLGTSQICHIGINDGTDALWPRCLIGNLSQVRSGLLHGDVSPSTSGYYYNQGGKIVGTLTDYDYHNYGRRSKAREESNRESESKRNMAVLFRSAHYSYFRPPEQRHIMLETWKDNLGATLKRQHECEGDLCENCVSEDSEWVFAANNVHLHWHR